MPSGQTVKKNVSIFENDVREKGGYSYTGEKCSARLANARISRAIGEAYPFRDASLLDVGCGDGVYTMELASFGVRHILGVDAGVAAIEKARARAAAAGLSGTVHFEVGNAYALDPYLVPGRFDCIVIRGVLHHLFDPAAAISGLQRFKGTVIILEPNGWNPVLKVLERVSKYHIVHEERSFTPGRITQWLLAAGFAVQSTQVINLVPMFCPDWMAKLCKQLTPVVERLPLLRLLACGQTLIVARR